VTKATESVEDLTKVDTTDTPTVEVKQPGFADTLFNGTREFLAQTLLVFVLLYFLLASADGFMPKVAAALPGGTNRAGRSEIVQRIETEISAYLLTVTLINTGLGVVTGFIMFAFGMPSPILWGALAGVLNFIPLVGPFLVLVTLGVVSMLTFNQFSYAILIPLSFVVLTTIEGWFITPTLIGRRLTLSPIAIVLALFLWSWLWGAPGALIAVPTLAMFKMVCDRVESMRSIAALMEP
jgi:predicted PurR-regulated permease PerM